MSYVWQSVIQKGDLIDINFYNSIQDTYNQIMTYHCSADNTTYKETNNTNDDITNNTNYTVGGTTCTAYRRSYYSSYDRDGSSTTRYTTNYNTNDTSYVIP